MITSESFDDYVDLPLARRMTLDSESDTRAEPAPGPEQGTVAEAAGAQPLVMWLATGLGVGWAPFAPGTWGTLVGLPLAWAVYQLDWGWRIAATVFLIAIGGPICGYAALRLHAKDPGMVVYDEIASLPLVFLGVDQIVGWNRWTLPVLLLGFGMHRVFDIFKPPPVRQLESLPGGWGILADDLGAALYACLAVHAVLWIVRLAGG